MAAKTQIIRTNTADPWWNLAVEEYLLGSQGKDEFILYLWQNQNTVVIGKNQNAWRECRTGLLEKEGGKLARRLSGGGAVFHDMGNLNFTFLMNRNDYNFEKQIGVIVKAVNKVGIKAEMSGRNDIVVSGKKFSGNAFCFKKNNAYHHGTILISADFGKLSRYLQVSEEKIRSKGIESVKSRVANLSEYKPGLSIDEMSDALIEAFEEIYGKSDKTWHDVDWMDRDTLLRLYEKYSSWDWRYGETPKFDIEFSERFKWGGVEIGLKLENGRISKAYVYSDAMDEEFIGMLPESLKGCIFVQDSMAGCILDLRVDKDKRSMQEDIAGWIKNKNF